MTYDDQLAETFEQHRSHLLAVAYRMLGSRPEAEDAVQEAWLRLYRSDTSDVANLAGWLTTVVARVCLDTLRSRASRREELVAEDDRAATRVDAVVGEPEAEAQLADSVGLDMLVVLYSLRPAERLAFVLHDMFAVSFEEIGPMLGRTPTATCQLVSRARRKVQAPAAVPDADRARRRQVVEAFLNASRAGDFTALVELLHPQAVMRADRAAVASGASAEVRGAAAVAETFSGRARATRLAQVDGYPAAVWTVRGAPKVVLGFTVEDGRIVEIELLADPETLDHLDLETRDA